MSAVASSRRVSSGKKDYGYCNARVRGMKSRLLGQQFLERLMESHDMSQLITTLSETEYRSELEEALIHGRTAEEIDEALKNNMVRTYRKVQGFLNDEAAEIMPALLGRWDLFDVKTIIRGKHMQLPVEEIEESLLDVGVFSAVELKALSRQEDVKAVSDTLTTWGSPYAVPLRACMAEYQQDLDLSVVELALDRYYYGWASEILEGRGPARKVARDILGMQVDSINLVTLFRLMKTDVSEMDPARFFLPGGRFLREEVFLAAAALSDVDEVLDLLKRTPYGSQLEAVVVTYVEEGSIAVFERAMEDFVMRKALTVGTGDPLGFGVLVSYLWAKQNEVTNLRIVVKGRAVGMPAERIRKELIVV